MTIFSYNQKRTKEIQQAIYNAPPGYKVYFQPTHHGGCVQVLKMKAGSKTEAEYCANIFKSSVTGYNTFLKRLGVLSPDVLKIKKEWIKEMILVAKTLRFKVKPTKEGTFVTLQWVSRQQVK